MDGGASNSCPAEWKSRNINFDFLTKSKETCSRAGLCGGWPANEFPSVDREWNPIASKIPSTQLEALRDSDVEPHFHLRHFLSLFCFSFRFILTRASDWKWKATRPRHRLLPEKNVPPITQVNSSDFPRHLFFFHQTARLSLSLMAAFLSTDSFVPSAVRVYTEPKTFTTTTRWWIYYYYLKEKTHRLRLPLRWAPKREARPPAALISASVGILWEPKTTKHFDIVHTRLLIDSIPVQNRKFFLFWFLLLSSSKWTGSGEIVKRPRNRVAIVRDYDAVCWRMAGPMKREDEWR